MRVPEFRCLVAILLLCVFGHAPAYGVGRDGGAHANLGFGLKQKFHLAVHAKGHPPIKLYAEEAGKGEPIVFLHGFGGSSYTFRKIAPALAQRYRVLTIDLKGHGRSDKPFDTNYSAHDQAVLIYWFMRQHGLRNVTLAGHSFGGQVALELAVMLRTYDRHRIRRLILISTPAYPQKLTPAIRLLRKPVLPYAALTIIPRELPITFALMSEAVGLKHQITQEDVDIYSQPYADAGARHALIQTARQIVPESASRVIARYPMIRQPALLIYCRNDQSVPLSTGTRLATALARAHLSVLDGCDHIPPEQRPAAVVREILKFMD